MAESGNNSSNRLRGEGGKFIGVKDPPLVDLKVANPVNYLKIWWAKIIGNEGMEFSFRIRPLTAISLVLIIAAVGFGVGRITVPPLISQYVPFLPTAEPSVNPWRSTAYTGILRYSEATQKYYLDVGSGETVNLEVIPNLDLKKFIGRRILAVGNLNQSTGLLRIQEAKDLEVLPLTTISIPTLIPTPTSLFPSPEATPQASAEPTL